MKKPLYLLFTIYILVVLKLTVFRTATLTDYQYNLALFSDLINVYRTQPLWEFLRLFLGNLGWFAPFGFFLPILTRLERLLPVLLGGFYFSIFIELSQLVFKKGVFEIDDLILNTIGTAIGYAAYIILKRLKEKWC